MSAPRPTLHLHIERLVLDGLPFHGPDAALFQSGFEAELARLVREGDVTALARQAGAVRSLPAAEFVFDANAGPRLSGCQAAAALCFRLGLNSKPAGTPAAGPDSPFLVSE